ncbi:MAG: hypothetical protein JWR63_2311 [Conexibacter sp.]|nr:hypothetical protein [Conexibacter sp.]MCW2996921.1 hypothetical protein [Solirubrobacterales bacterium]
MAVGSLVTMAYRFVIEKVLTAQVSSHADIAARLLEHLVKRKEHYDKVVLPPLRAMTNVPPPDRTIEGAWNATADQLLAASADLLALMRDAQAQGSKNLQKRTGRSAGQKLDLTLTAPSSPSPEETVLTLQVMRDGLGRAARDASDEIDRLVAWLGPCEDPVARDFVAQMQRLAGQIRPTGFPPGPHAPTNVEASGPPGHVALMSRFAVDLVACFAPNVDLLLSVLNVLPSDQEGRASLGPLAENVDVVVPTAGDRTSSALHATYTARGQNEDEACQYALGLFERSRDEFSLPSPAHLTATARTP